MDSLKPPKELSLEQDVVTNFKKWKKQFEVYMEASGIVDNKSVSNERREAILLHTIGPEVQDIYDTLEIPEEDEKNWRKVLNHIENYFKPKENETVNRHLFHTRKQKEGECIDMFVTDLRKLSQNCNFGDLKDSLIRDTIVCGVNDIKIRNRLLRESDLDLTHCINIYKAAEVAKMQSQQLTEESNSAVLGIKKVKNHL